MKMSNVWNMKHLFAYLNIICLVLLLSVRPALAFNMSSGNYSVEGGNFDTGGGESSSPNFLLYGFSGEDYLAAATSANFANSPGLAFFPTPTPTPSSSSSSSSGTSGSSSSSTTSTTATPTPTATSGPIALAPVTTPEAEEEVGAPSQLFDIALIIDDPLIENSRQLKARVTFVSFGTEATPVDMEFIVLGATGQELYRTTGRTVIQTEGLYNQIFKDLEIPDGKYTLLLKTLYGDNIRDEFRAPFEVKKAGLFAILNRILWPWGAIALAFLGLMLIIFLIRRRRKKGKNIKQAFKNAQ